MSMLLTGDIHLDSNPENEHRWGLLPWILKQVTEYGIKHVLILGDLTSAKDKHNSLLVNRFIAQVEHLLRYSQVFILKGNHDFINPDVPFFGFINYMGGSAFITEPEQHQFFGNVLFLPATKDPEKDWEGIDFSKYDYIFTHQTYKGVMTETGHALPGVDPKIFGDTNARILSGDIHMPISIEGTNITYVGAPYRTNYGDTYNPRLLYINNEGVERDLHYPCPSKHLLTVSNIQDIRNNITDIPRGDFIKVRVRLRRADYPEWHKLKQEIVEYVAEQGLVLHGKPELVQLIENHPRLATPTNSRHRDPKELVLAYAKQNNLSPETEQVGLDLIKEII